MKVLWFLVRPTPTESLLYVFASIILLSIRSFSAVLDALFSEEISIADVGSVGGAVDSSFQDFFGSFNSSGATATVTTLIFWSAAGALIYMIMWALLNGVKEFYNEASSVDTVVHGRGENITNPVRQQFTKLLFRFTVVIFTIAYLILFLRLIVPLSSELFSNGVVHLLSINGFLQTTLSILLTFVGIHVFTVLARLVALKLRIYGIYSV